jgi:hypothetical protein
MAPRKVKKQSKRRQPKGPRRSKKISSFPLPSRASSNLSHSYKTGVSRTHLAMQVCSRINPFCREALGAKIPDESAGFTVTFQSRYFIQTNSDSNGNGAVYLQPYPVSSYYYPSSVNNANGIIAWASPAASPDYAALLATYRDLRVVSWGARTITTQPWTTAQGLAIISTVQTIPTAASTGAISVASMTNGSDTQCYAVRDLDATFISKPTDHMWTAFANVASPGGDADSLAPPWSQFLMLLTQGTPSVTLLNTEVVVNYELRVYAGITTTLNQLATQPVRNNPPLAQIIDTVRQRLPTTIKTSGSSSIDSSIWDFTMNTMKTMAPSLLDMALTSL